MNYEHEKGIKALELCLNMHHVEDEELASAGLTREDIMQIKNGNKLMTEDQLYKFAFVMRSPNLLQRPLVDWLNCGGLWALAGIAEPTFSINGSPIRAIMDLPYIFINNPDVHVSIDDVITHIYPDGYEERFFIEDIDYAPYSRGYKPIYKLTVTRSKQDMHNTNNFTFGDHTQISGNTRFNAGSVIDNSTNEVHELPADFFEQTRALLAEANTGHRLELQDMLTKIEAAHATNNKKDCGNWFGKFFSLASVADCITVVQPLLPLISWLMTNA